MQLFPWDYDSVWLMRKILFNDICLQKLLCPSGSKFKGSLLGKCRLTTRFIDKTSSVCIPRVVNDLNS